MMCPNCAKETVYYQVNRRAYVCFTKDCGFCRSQAECDARIIPILKPRVVIEVKDGSLLSVYSDVDAEFILVDHDDDGCISSTVIIPDKIVELPERTKVMAEDAVRRNQQ